VYKHYVWAVRCCFYVGTWYLQRKQSINKRSQRCVHSFGMSTGLRGGSS